MEQKIKKFHSTKLIFPKIKILILPNNGNLLLVDTPIAIDNEISFNLIENLSFMPEKN